MENFSSFERAVGNISESEKEQILRNERERERFNNQVFEDLKTITQFQHKMENTSQEQPEPENIQEQKTDENPINSIDMPRVKILKEDSQLKEEKTLEVESSIIKRALAEIEATNIFDKNYLRNLQLVVFNNQYDAQFLFEDNALKRVKRNTFNAQDFMQGRRIDFVGISSKDEFVGYDRKNLSDKQFIIQLFFPEQMTYEEFAAHEIGHNVFDKEYKLKQGEYEGDETLTDVSDEFRDSIKNRLKDLIGKYFPNLDIEHFEFNRQKIAEIAALTFQREFCKRADNNFDPHRSVLERVRNFLENPEQAIDKLNAEHKRNCTIEDFYMENHSLSFVVAPLLEQEYPDFNQRLEFFWRNTPSN